VEDLEKGIRIRLREIDGERNKIWPFIGFVANWSVDVFDNGFGEARIDPKTRRLGTALSKESMLSVSRKLVKDRAMWWQAYCFRITASHSSVVEKSIGRFNRLTSQLFARDWLIRSINQSRNRQNDFWQSKIW
jgi:hypothetical protein